MIDSLCLPAISANCDRYPLICSEKISYSLRKGSIFDRFFVFHVCHASGIGSSYFSFERDDKGNKPIRAVYESCVEISEHPTVIQLKWFALEVYAIQKLLWKLESRFSKGFMNSSIRPPIYTGETRLKNYLGVNGSTNRLNHW